MAAILACDPTWVWLQLAPEDSCAEVICWTITLRDAAILKKRQIPIGRGEPNALPNEANLIGTLEAVRAPYQRDDADPVYGDVLFLWWLHS